MDIDTFRETLVHLGITPSILAGIGIASLITLFFSVRVVLKWYLGIQQVHDDVRMVSLQVADLQLQLSQVRLRKDVDGDGPADSAPEKSGRGAETFRLNH